MAVKVLIERTVRRGHERTVLNLLRELRAASLSQPGYISGETLRDPTDPSVILVISVWFGLGDWRRWLNAPERAKINEQIEPHLTGPAHIRVFMEGLSDLHSGA